MNLKRLQIFINNPHVYKVAKEFNMCYVTLRRFVQKRQNHRSVKLGYNPHNRVFNKEEGQELVKYARNSSKLYYRLTGQWLKKLAFEYAVAP